MKILSVLSLCAAGALWIQPASAQLDYTHHAEPISDVLTVEETADLVSLALKTSAQASLKDHIDALFDALDIEGAPGAAVLVAKNGETIYERYYGMANLEHGIPIGPETIFHAGSVTKQFTGYAIMRLAEQGLVDLDAPARSYLPRMPDFGTPITVRHLLHHTSGLRSYPAMIGLAGWRLQDSLTIDDAWRLIEQQVDLNYPAGEEWSYTNTAFFLLSRIVEAVTKETFKDWMQSNVFQPIGMTQSHIHNDSNNIVLHNAQSFTFENNSWKTSINLASGASGAGALTTSARDLTIWLSHLNDLETSEPQFWATLVEPGKLNNGNPAVLSNFGPYTGAHYAAGLFTRTVEGVKYVEHAGGIAAFASNAVLAPEHGITVIILSNTGQGGAHARAWATMRLALMAEGAIPAPPQQTPSAPVGEASVVEPDLNAVRAAAGVYYLERSKAPEVWRGNARLNIPSIIPMAFRMRDDNAQWTRGGPWRRLPPTKRGTFMAAGVELAIDGNGIRAADGSFELNKTSCTERDRRRLAGRYRSEEARAEIEVRRPANSALIAEHDRLGPVDLLCATPNVFLAVSDTWTGLGSGFTILETVRKRRRVVGIRASLGSRMRRIHMDRITH